jgi:hypothetical protein
MNEQEMEFEGQYDVEEIIGDAATLDRADLNAMMFGTYQDVPALNMMNKQNPFDNL